MTEEMFREDATLRQMAATVQAVDAEGVVLDRTVSYPMGGGQPGDTGTLRLANGGAVQVTDTVYGTDGRIRHVVAADAAGALLPGTQVIGLLDWDRRYRHMRLHTCLHVLCGLVPGAVTGGNISDGKARLDFNLPEATLDKADLTERLNAVVSEDRPVRHFWISDDELAARPELVRTMSVKPPTGSGRVRVVQIDGIDLQPCGGTHVAGTAEIGAVRVTKIEKKGRMNRRVNIVLADA